MRGWIALLLSVAVAGIFSGCSTTGGTWRTALGLPAKPAADKTETAETKPAADTKSKDKVASTEAAKDKDKPADKVAEAEAKPSPFKPSREKPAETTVTKVAEPAVAKPASTEKPASTSSGASWSPEIVQLIGDELRDATPEERADWHENLKRVDPAVIPDILRARRLSRKMAETAPKAPTEPERPIVDTPPQRPVERDFGWQREPRSLPNLESEIAARPRVTDRVHPVGFTNPTNENRVTHATYQAAADQPQRVDYASNQVPQPPAAEPRSGPVVLQGYVVDDGVAPGTDGSRPDYSQIGGSSPPRTYASTQPDIESIAWPPSNKPVATGPNGRNPSTSSLPFGTGFVQNVVGLVPNRGNSNAAAVNPPATVTPPTTPSLPWRAELERTIAALEQEVATLKPSNVSNAQNDYLRKHVALRQLYLLTDRQERALTAIPGIDPADQEFWQQVFWGMSNYMDLQHIPRPQDRASQTISQFNTAVRRLQEQADLQIRNVAFCRQIQYFGNYERFPRDEFRPGQEVLLYAEVENFKSEPTADGQYRTLLRSTIEILSPNGELRKQIDFAATEDLCRNYRRDYFHNYQFVIPDRIPLGPHTLKLTVFDELSGRMVSYTTNFNVQ